MSLCNKSIYYSLVNKISTTLRSSYLIEFKVAGIFSFDCFAKFIVKGSPC